MSTRTTPRGQRPRLTIWFQALACSVAACVMALGTPLPVAAGTQTAAILSNTVAAAPSCLSYRLEGMCFFLSCSWTGCRVRSSLKVSHYVPDVVISTYNDPSMHPWSDMGTLVATTINQTMGRAMLAGVLPDSSAGGLDTPSAMTNFKGGDAIGNPAGMFAQLIASGGSVTMPNKLVAPGTSEFAQFFSREMPRIGQRWTQVPQAVIDGVAGDAVAFVQNPGNLMNTVRNMLSAINGVRQTMELYHTVSNISTALQSLSQIAGALNGATGGQTFFCPGSASLFSLHFQSELDAYSWRGMLPLEMLYPESWVPTLQEVGGTATTWGSIYPRTGEVIQPHPVKASAVLATRIQSIITQEAQPHVYTRLTPSGGGYRYFETGQSHRWQMLYPTAQKNCIQFGQNDSLSLTSFGDGQTSSEDGYAWNLWRKYECCRSRGSYLFSVP